MNAIDTTITAEMLVAGRNVVLARLGDIKAFEDHLHSIEEVVRAVYLAMQVEKQKSAVSVDTWRRVNQGYRPTAADIPWMYDPLFREAT